jgi:hypothetical protein
MIVRWGPMQVSVEGGLHDWPDVAAQARHDIDLTRPSDLWMSDLLLGDSVDAPPLFRTRDEVRFYGLTDSVVQVGSPVAIYWELYGARSDSLGSARYTVQVHVREPEGRGIGAVVARALGGVLGMRRESSDLIEFSVIRPAGAVLPSVLVLEGLPKANTLSISIMILDTVGGGRTRSERIISVI